MSGKALIQSLRPVRLSILVDSFREEEKKKKAEDRRRVVVASGVTAEWGWRVVEGWGGSAVPGFGGAGSRLYYGYVAEPEAKDDWKIVQQEGVDTIAKAKNLALEFIAQHVGG
jgi:hypothetical protein